MILDDNFEELQTRDENSTIYPVREKLWRETIIRYRKKANQSRFLFMFSAIILAYFLPISIWVLAGCFLISMVQKNIMAQRCHNLIHHGNLEYEAGTDRVTRYSKSNYQIFYKEDIKQVTKHSFGLIIRKKNYASFDFLGLTTLNIENQDLLILPSELAYYDKISKDILNMFAEE